MKNFLISAILILSSTISISLFGQGKLPIVKTTISKISVRDGENFKKAYWTISPGAKPDIYNVTLPKGKSHKVTLYTDIDSISFIVEADKKYDFIIQKGDTLCYTQLAGVTQVLKKFTEVELFQDFDILLTSLKEAHTGLYWYTSFSSFDSLCKSQREKIKNGLTSVDFWNIIAPITAATREGHCEISLSDNDREYLQTEFNYLPFYVKFLNHNLYIVNDLADIKSQGKIISKINGLEIGKVLEKIFSTISSDGYNISLKYDWLDNYWFSIFYSKCFPQTEKYEIEMTETNSANINRYEVEGVRYFKLKEYGAKVEAEIQKKESKNNSLTIIEKSKTAILNLSFGSYDILAFHHIIDSFFTEIIKRKVNSLIIDLRNNEGGVEGYEDYVFSYLNSKPYTKYKYVQASAFTYSFYKYTNYNTLPKQNSFEEILKDEHQLCSDGRIIRKSGILTPEKPKQNGYKGNIFVLTSGLTYSGGAEFASLLKGFTQSKFIGKEVGGGYYGNTSGMEIRLTLPNSNISIRIPLLKFVLDIKGIIPFGHGVLPDYKIEPTFKEYIKGIDTELEFAKKLATKK